MLEILAIANILKLTRPTPPASRKSLHFKFNLFSKMIEIVDYRNMTNDRLLNSG
jgi:hypothetical protein